MDESHFGLDDTAKGKLLHDTNTSKLSHLKARLSSSKSAIIGGNNVNNDLLYSPTTTQASVNYHIPPVAVTDSKTTDFNKVEVSNKFNITEDDDIAAIHPSTKDNRQISETRQRSVLNMFPYVDENPSSSRHWNGDGSVKFRKPKKVVVESDEYACTSKKSSAQSVKSTANPTMFSADYQNEQLSYFLSHGGKIEKDINWNESNSDSFYIPQPNKPIPIAMNTTVLNMDNIDTANMSYRMKLEIWVAWPLTEKEVIRYYENPDEWKPYIHPEPTPWTISIEEIQKIKFLSGRTTQVLLWRGKFMACECTLVTAIYLETLELVNFPFDCQHFHAIICLRCDCDVPLKVVNGKVLTASMDAIGGFTNVDGRAMASMELDKRGCHFSVKTHLLTLKDFKLVGIECEIDNSCSDGSFFHCTLRMSRNYESYIFRIFIPIFMIIITTTLVFRFGANQLSAKLTFVVINMLTIMSFFFVVSGILPQIPYLTFIDKYMNMALVYICGVGAACVVLHEFEYDGTSLEDYVFIGCLLLLVFSHITLFMFCWQSRRIEFHKTKLNRYQVDELEVSRILNSWFTHLKVEKSEEFYVHTDIHHMDDEYKVYEGLQRNDYSEKELQKQEADDVDQIGWLFEDKPKTAVYFLRKETKEKSKKHLRRHTATITPYFQQAAARASVDAATELSAESLNGKTRVEMENSEPSDYYDTDDEITVSNDQQGNSDPKTLAQQQTQWRVSNTLEKKNMLPNVSVADLDVRMEDFDSSPRNDEDKAVSSSGTKNPRKISVFSRNTNLLDHILKKGGNSDTATRARSANYKVPGRRPSVYDRLAGRGSTGSNVFGNAKSSDNNGVVSSRRRSSLFAFFQPIESDDDGKFLKA